METKYEYGDSEGGKCHICLRPLDNHKPRHGKVVEGRREGNKFGATVSESKGIGICPEHSVSYDVRSMADVKCRTCQCGKDDCPVCEEGQ